MENCILDLPFILAESISVPGYVVMAYIVAGICFILSLGGLSQHESASRGNLFGIAGIVIAVVATLVSGVVSIASGNVIYWLLPLIVGCLIGGALASRVKMESMPQLVAILHSFVGLAAVLVGVATYIAAGSDGSLAEAAESAANAAGELVEGDADEVVKVDEEQAPVEHLHGGLSLIHKIEVFLGVFIGAITFTGSIVAWGKLEGVIKSKPWKLPGGHYWNAGLVIACAILGLIFLFVSSISIGLSLTIVMTFIAFFIGVHLVMGIGGADMPVVVSMLNSYSGWAAAATGFLLGNDLLIITGALVGSSGAILSYIMCAAMNRSFISVILGGFGTDGGTVAKNDDSGFTARARAMPTRWRWPPLISWG